MIRTKGHKTSRKITSFIFAKFKISASAVINSFAYMKFEGGGRAVFPSTAGFYVQSKFYETIASVRCRFVIKPPPPPPP